MISYDEYHAMVADIYRLADEEQNNFFTPAEAKLMEVVELGDDAIKAMERVNEVLKKLEKEISKNNEDYKNGKNGGWIMNPLSVLSYSPRNALYGYQYSLKEIVGNFKKGQG